MPDQTEVARTDRVKSFMAECAEFWRSLPLRTPFLVMLGAWLVLFQFYGNSTLGLVHTRSLFGWWVWTIKKSPDETYAFLMPLVVVGLLLWRRKDLEAVPKQICWPALGLVIFALLLHLLGYMIQQARVSVIAFVLGLYGLTGLVWGRRWLYATLFPFSLLLLCMPLGDSIEPLTFACGCSRRRLRVRSATSARHSCDFQRHVSSNRTAITFMTWRPRAVAFESHRYFRVQHRHAVHHLESVLAPLGHRGLGLAPGCPRQCRSPDPIVIAAEAFGHEAGKFVHASTFSASSPMCPPFLMLFSDICSKR
jgi:hypothetical protein